MQRGGQRTWAALLSPVNDHAQPPTWVSGAMSGSFSGRAVELFLEQVGVAVVAGVLLDHVRAGVIMVCATGAAREAGGMLDTDFVLDAAARERLIDRFGAGAGSWCDALPGLVERCCQRWGLELDEALSGGTSRVFMGRRRGGRGVVLKLTPDPSVADGEALALHAWARTPHVVDLLEADTEAGALLLEEIEPGTRLADQPGLPSFEEIAGLLASLRVADADHGGRLPAQAERPTSSSG